MNAKSRLFEYCAQHQLSPPVFTSWQNKDNKWESVVTCFDNKFECEIEDSFSRKKDAENAVAMHALMHVKHIECGDDICSDDVYEDDVSEKDEKNNEKGKVCDDLVLIMEYVNGKGILKMREPYYTWVTREFKEDSCKIEYLIKDINVEGRKCRLRHLKIYNQNFDGWEFDIPDFSEILPSGVEWFCSYSGVNTYDDMFRLAELDEYIQITLSCE